MGEAAPFGKGRVRKLFGLDRSGPEPTATRSGQPLRPFTLPNLVGFIRLLLIPVFLVVAFDSGDGTSWLAAGIFWVISAGDYLDGLLARVTGQYSRLGALLDPIVDRLTILSGVIVCWHFELLPRWLLLVLALRELDGLSYNEIAAVLRVSIGTVESRLHRARARLKDVLSNDD